MSFKTLLTILFVLITPLSFADKDYKNYVLTIDGKKYEVNLNKEEAFKDKDGKKISIKLQKKPYTQFSDKFLSFQHKSSLGVSSRDLGAGIRQLMSATATGTLIMIQEYDGLEHSGLVETMLKELTKESIDYGYKLSKEKLTRKTASGETLTGLKATLTYRKEASYWEVLAYDKKDSGVLIITQIDKEFMNTDKGVLSVFWKTLEFNFK